MIFAPSGGGAGSLKMIVSSPALASAIASASRRVTLSGSAGSASDVTNEDGGSDTRLEDLDELRM